MKRPSLIDLQEAVSSFNRARGWRDKHTALQLAMSVGIEAAELMECFQWMSEANSLETVQRDSKLRARVESEAADVLIYLLSLCDVAEIDLASAVQKKLAKNVERFPVRRSV